MASSPQNGFIKLEDEDTDAPRVVMNHPSGSQCVVHLNGGCVTKFKPCGWSADDNGLLFLSSKAIYQKGKAIRGGVPVMYYFFLLLLLKRLQLPTIWSW